jgi:hypothetical protein
MNGKTWLRRNVKPFNTAGDSVSHILQSGYIASLPGYVNFSGVKEIRDPDFAGMPVAAIAEQNELRLEDKDGVDWAWASDLLYSPAELAKTVSSGTHTIAIGTEGYNEWLNIATESSLRFNIPATGRLIVFTNENAPIHDTLRSGEGKYPADIGPIVVKPGFKVELIGYPGDEFIVRNGG